MLSLAIDTSVGVSVALVDETVVINELSVDSHGVQGEKTTALIAELLHTSGREVNDVSDVVVGVGPGPFTGLRVGIATAQAFAFARKIPVVGICSLDGIGLSQERPCVVVTDARRKEVYWAHYDGLRVSGPSVATPETLLANYPQANYVGPGLGIYLHVFSGQLLSLNASNLVYVARRFPDLHLPLTPLYLRNPDAVEPTSRKSVL